jgi:hypothetical protein
MTFFLAKCIRFSKKMHATVIFTLDLCYLYDFLKKMHATVRFTLDLCYARFERVLNCASSCPAGASNEKLTQARELCVFGSLVLLLAACESKVFNFVACLDKPF